ncbi:hypothetical protein [uncultured Friedmanniella sp.]|uniref:hypothetical protein n=1 Tax=uncultured Friedmanniella sp. TaxID=335381 RepID=UPI0035CBF51F
MLSAEPGTEVLPGPFPPGTVRESGGLTVTQTDAQHVEISYGESWVRLASPVGGVYAFSVGPPIAGPPQAAPALGPLIPKPDPDTKPVLPQRLVRVTATDQIVEQHQDENARIAPLAVQSRLASAAGVAEAHPEIGDLDILESAEADHAQLQLEETLVRVEAAPGKEGGFAYWIDPEWTGAQSDERRVTVVAAPGVRVRTGAPAHAPVITYGRRLTTEVVRVPHPGLVPAQGSRIELSDFVGVETIGDRPDQGLPISTVGPMDPAAESSDTVHIGTGRSGVTIEHPWSEARVTVAPTDPEVGAAYAWQVLPPVNGSPGEIRVVVGPGVRVDVAEPVPVRLRSSDGSAISPKPSEAGPGDGLRDQAFELTLVEVAEVASVPAQGTPLNLEHLRGLGRTRAPDGHVWLGTSDAATRLATSLVDAAIGFIPVLGQLYTIGEFAYAASTGEDFWGNEIDDAGLVVMGFGAALSVIPLVGGIRALVTGSRELAKVAELAARWGLRAEELEALLVRVGSAAEGADATLVQKAVRALQKGGSLTEQEVDGLRRILGRVGAGSVALEGLTLSATGTLELALATGGTPLRSETYLSQLLSAYRTTGAVPDELVRPLAVSGHFGNAEEAELAVQQALRDLARSEGVAADETMIAAAARSSGEAVARVQTAATEVVPSQTRTTQVAQPQLLAEYERLVDQKLPAVIQDALARQRTTPTRVRLAQLRTQFDQLRTQVGDARTLTNAQRDAANDLLREARDLSEADFNNLRDAVWRRLRNPRRHPDLAALERRMRTAGNLDATTTGAPRLRTATPDGIAYDSMNLEHRIRRSDNPWRYNDPTNLIAADGPQNQQYLEGIRQQGSIWPTDAVEEFVVRFGLNDQGINFAPRSR